MTRTRNPETYAATLQAIKATARRLLQTQGVDGVTIRGIAKELEMTPPAIYTYYPSLEDLITALIVDAFTQLAAAMQSRRELAETPIIALCEALRGYRVWGNAHPTDFQLIFGTPIPGYVAPREVTVPAVIQVYRALVGAVEEVLVTGVTLTPPYQAIPATVMTHLTGLIETGHYPVSAHAMYIGDTLLGFVHGLTMLEITHHLTPTVGDTNAFFEAQLSALLHSIGLNTSRSK
jgi:AcrR family transcriptional regulator